MSFTWSLILCLQAAVQLLVALPVNKGDIYFTADSGYAELNPCAQSCFHVPCADASVAACDSSLAGAVGCDCLCASNTTLHSAERYIRECVLGNCGEDEKLEVDAAVSMLLRYCGRVLPRAVLLSVTQSETLITSTMNSTLNTTSSTELTTTSSKPWDVSSAEPTSTSGDSWTPIPVPGSSSTGNGLWSTTPSLNPIPSSTGLPNTTLPSDFPPTKTPVPSKGTDILGVVIAIASLGVSVGTLAVMIGWCGVKEAAKEASTNSQTPVQSDSQTPVQSDSQTLVQSDSQTPVQSDSQPLAQPDRHPNRQSDPQPAGSTMYFLSEISQNRQINPDFVQALLAAGFVMRETPPEKLLTDPPTPHIANAEDDVTSVNMHSEKQNGASEATPGEAPTKAETAAAAPEAPAAVSPIIAPSSTAHPQQQQFQQQQQQQPQ